MRVGGWGSRFQKLPPASNGKFLRCLIVFFSLYMAKHGPDMLLDQMEAVQAGLLEQFMTCAPALLARTCARRARVACVVERVRR